MQNNHLMVVCDMNFNNYEAFKRKYEEMGGPHVNI